jgi:hypothetical protein
MSGPAPPLRFLGAVIGGWVVLRAATFAFWPGNPVQTKAVMSEPVAIARAIGHQTAGASSVLIPIREASATAPAPAPVRLPVNVTQPSHPDWRCCAAPAFALAAVAPAVIDPAQSDALSASPPALAATLMRTPVTAARWTASAWLLARRETASSILAPGGTLGGSQAGGRITYRLSGEEGPLIRLSGRAYVPLRRTSGAEIAIGLDWQPVARLPLYLLAERRQALGDDGRSAFSLTLYGGRSAQLPLGVRLDSYAQAGIVGIKSRDLFVDGAVQLRRPVGPIEIGAGAWGAAQPGAARLDIGPQISVRLPIERANLRISADWRFRVAGDAAPGSGPALTLGADF